MNSRVIIVCALISASCAIGAERKEARKVGSSENPSEAAILTSLLKHYTSMREKTPVENVSQDNLIKLREKYAKQLDKPLAIEVIKQCQGFALNGTVNEDVQKCCSINDLIACSGCLTNLIETERLWKRTVFYGETLAKINRELNALEATHYAKVRETLANYSRMLMECPAQPQCHPITMEEGLGTVYDHANGYILKDVSFRNSFFSFSGAAPSDTVLADALVITYYDTQQQRALKRYLINKVPYAIPRSDRFEPGEFRDVRCTVYGDDIGEQIMITTSRPREPMQQPLHAKIAMPVKQGSPVKPSYLTLFRPINPAKD